ncbi:MAG: type Z 30S ribosomal protein S14 [Patescibacteria group bacterium]
MAKKSRIAKSARTPKYSTRIVRRCWRCGRNRGYIKRFDMCRICLREAANKGHVPGLRKSSW